MDKLLAMRSFVAIVDHGSLTAAATALDRSLPTMVRTLAALEDSLGTRLLRRTTRRMSLTGGKDQIVRCVGPDHLIEFELHRIEPQDVAA